jgi:hypothetical protein
MLVSFAGDTLFTAKKLYARNRLNHTFERQDSFKQTTT